jgi:hypothetical protein
MADNDNTDQGKLMLSILQELRGDMADVKGQLALLANSTATKDDLTILRIKTNNQLDDMWAALPALREEVRSEMTATRKELKTEIDGLRTEMRAENAELRAMIRNEGEMARAETKLVGRVSDRNEQQIGKLVTTIQFLKENMDKVVPALSELSRSVLLLEKQKA